MNRRLIGLGLAALAAIIVLVFLINFASVNTGYRGVTLGWSVIILLGLAHLHDTSTRRGIR